jgi:hypothetical protein
LDEYLWHRKEAMMNHRNLATKPENYENCYKPVPVLVKLLYPGPCFFALCL